MAYRLKPGLPVPGEIKRIVGEEVEAAAGQLAGEGEGNRDQAIHEARKSIKKIRGVLRLMQPELGAVYRAENVRFRDMGRQLSQFRDAGAMLESFDLLLEEYKDELGRRRFGAIRRGLNARKAEAERRGEIDKTLRRMATGMRASGRRVERWPLDKSGFAAIARGLKDTFRRGRKAMRAARRAPCAESYHEWRKRVKEHWYHVRLLESIWSGGMEKYEKSLKELETALGEDHNLALLEAKIAAEPVFYGKPAEIEAFLKLVERFHEKLRERAGHLGKSIYAPKPRRFQQEMERLWEARQGES